MQFGLRHVIAIGGFFLITPGGGDQTIEPAKGQEHQGEGKGEKMTRWNLLATITVEKLDLRT